MNTFSLKIIATNKIFYDGRCTELIIPGIDGSKGILAHHEDMVIAIAVGEMQVLTQDGSWHKAVVGTVFAQIANNRVTVLVDTVERPEDIDELRAREALERAKEQLRQEQSVREYHMSQASLARAIYRLKETGKGNINMDVSGVRKN